MKYTYILCTWMDTFIYVFSSCFIQCVCAWACIPPTCQSLLRPQPWSCHLIQAESQAEPSKHTPPLHPQLPLGQLKEQEPVEWASLCKLATELKWKCQAHHRSLLFVRRGPWLTGAHKQNTTKPVTVATSMFPFPVAPLCSAVCTKRKRATIEKVKIGVFFYCWICSGFI